MCFARHCSGAAENCEGKGTLGCLVYLALFGALALLAVKAGPPYFSYKGLESDVKTEVSRAGARFFNDEVLVKNIMDVARKNEIRLTKENIRVERLAGQLHVTIHYRVPIDFIITQRVFDFNIKTSSFIGSL